MARTYYVDSRIGSDSNAGTSASAPLASLAKVNSLNLQPGDVVLFANGSSYNGTLDVRSGTSGAPITYGAYGSGAKPVFSSSGTGIAIGSDHDVVIRDLQLKNVKGTAVMANGAANIVIDNVDFDTIGNGTNGAAAQFWHSSNITFQNSTVVRANGDDLWFWEVNGLKILNNNLGTPQGVSSDNIHTYRISNYEIRGNVLSFADATNSGKGNMIIQESKNGVIAENTFIMNYAHYGIGGTVQNGVIENNHFIGRVEGSWSVGLNITETLGTPSNATNMTIRNNFFDGSGIGIYTWDGNNAGTAYRNNFQITGNIFKNLRDQAMVSEWPVQLNGSFANNTLINTRDPAIGSTAGKWSVTGNVHTSVMPAWNGGADAYNPGTTTPATPAPTPEPAIIKGTEGNDTLNGTDGADTIWGDPLQDGPTGGNDVIRGGKGNDYISGGAGADTYVAERGGGTDTIRWFEAGKDKIDVKLFGWKSFAEMQAAGVTMTAGQDSNWNPVLTLNFGNGDVFKITGVSSLSASDFVFAPSPTTIDGTNGADTLKGTAASETINGKAGDDVLDGGAGNDTLDGGAGNDKLIGGDGNDKLIGGDGTDTAVYAGRSTDYAITMGTTVTIKDLKPTVDGDDGTDTLTGVEKAQFSDRVVFLDGTNNAPIAVNDTASTNEDTVVTGKLLANDFDFDGNALSATARTLTSAKGATVTIAADGTYTYDPRAAAALQALNTGASVVDSFTYTVSDGKGGSATGTVNITVAGITDVATAPAVLDWSKPTKVGTAGADNLVGTDGADVIWGDPQIDGPTGGADVIRGGKGNDFISGGAGADIYVGERGGGMDTLRWFEAGKDKIDVSLFGWKSFAEMQAAGVTMTGGQDANSTPTLTLNFGNGDGFKMTGVKSLAAADFVFAPATATVTGTDANDTLTAKDGVNTTLNGKGGHDTLNGGTDNDTLLGGAGNDVLNGKAGADRLDGGAGDDSLTGGAGNDVFVFAKGYGKDVITDFNAAEDKIDLSAFGLGSMAKLTASAGVGSAGTNALYVDFGSGDRLTVYGLGKLTADHVIF
jgi:VCBS repeat-containing protein